MKQGFFTFVFVATTALTTTEGLVAHRGRVSFFPRLVVSKNPLVQQRSSTNSPTRKPKNKKKDTVVLDRPTFTATSPQDQDKLQQERPGSFQFLLDFALDSPLWKHVLVPQARKKMVGAATRNGIPWEDCLEWIQSQDGPWKTHPNESIHDVSNIPEYYLKSIHAYEQGNLSWEAALEVELASCALGAKDCPGHGRLGEEFFRNSFQLALNDAGASPCPKGGRIVDLGSGTGPSTRRLAKANPQASQILGIDLSPYFCEVGTKLLEMAPIKSIEQGGPWVSQIDADDRIEYRVGNAAKTGLPDASVDIVNLQFVAHELPSQVTLSIFQEAHRILKPGGQFWFSDMDFESPRCVKMRSNPLLFALLRATEPYLDDFANSAKEYHLALKKLFASTTIVPAADGRYFSIVATKGTRPWWRRSQEHTLQDLRFDENGAHRTSESNY